MSVTDNAPLAISDRMADRLLQAGKLSARDMERAKAAQREIGTRLGQVLVQLGLVSESDVAAALSEELALPLQPDEVAVDLLPTPEGIRHDFWLKNCAIPLKEGNGELHVLMAAPEDSFVIKALQLATGLSVKPVVGLESNIRSALDRWTARGETPNDSASIEDGIDSDELLNDAGDFVEHLRDLASEAPVIRLVNAIVGRATELRASDIHLEPFDDGLHVRYRLDGVIQNSEVIPPAQSAAVSSRVKLLAHLDIAERRLPQDGRIKIRVKGRELDLRVSTVPTVHGESVVMRVLDRASVRFSLEQMGFARDNLDRFNELLTRPHGILLVTGPTGSGKTTTLYAGLSKLDAATQKIITVEDPVEYQLESINQIQVHAQINLTFANALRAILRQDPDIIMIGEMRDSETAQIAVQSALTGHLVLSTLHTNTAASAVVRMQDMGVERYLITSTVNGVLAQRLIRLLCPACKAPEALGDGLLSRSGLTRFCQPDRPIYKAVGCPNCRHSGYQGRTSIHELLVLTDGIRQAILDGKDAGALHQLAIQSGMLTLYEDGLRKVAAGLTSLEEVLRVTQDQSDA